MIALNILLKRWVGSQVGALHHVESTVASSGIAEEIIIKVDGGHINTTEEGKRSFEAMTAVIYRPEALVSNDKGTRINIVQRQRWMTARSR